MVPWPRADDGRYAARVSMDTDTTNEAPDVYTDLLRLDDGRIALQDSQTPDAWLATDTTVELPHR